MNGKHLLDTSIIVALFKNDDNVRNQIAASAEVFVPAIAVGELYYGALHSAHVEKNMNQVREFAEDKERRKGQDKERTRKGDITD